MSAEELFANYDWDSIVEWAKKEQEKAKLTQQKEEDFLEEQQIVDEIEIKQEIVLDPNE
jgi:hypothetical protein